MAQFWTRKKDNIQKDEQTADPWHIVSASSDLMAARLVPKAKPQYKNIDYTESPKE